MPGQKVGWKYMKNQRDNQMNKPLTFCAILAAVYISFLAGHIAGFSAGQKTEQEEAMKVGVAKWKLDEKGERKLFYGRTSVSKDLD